MGLQGRRRPDGVSTGDRQSLTLPPLAGGGAGRPGAVASRTQAEPAQPRSPEPQLARSQKAVRLKEVYNFPKSSSEGSLRNPRRPYLDLLGSLDMPADFRNASDKSTSLMLHNPRRYAKRCWKSTDLLIPLDRSERAALAVQQQRGVQLPASVVGGRTRSEASSLRDHSALSPRGRLSPTGGRLSPGGRHSLLLEQQQQQQQQQQRQQHIDQYDRPAYARKNSQDSPTGQRPGLSGQDWFGGTPGLDPGRCTATRLNALRKVSSQTHDLCIGADPEVAGAHQAFTTMDWRKSTLAAVPNTEDEDEIGESPEPKVEDREGSQAMLMTPPRSSLLMVPGSERKLLRTPRSAASSRLPGSSRVPSRAPSRVSSARAPSAAADSPQAQRVDPIDKRFDEDGLPSLSSKWARVQATCLRGEPFHVDDIEEMAAAFERFCPPHEKDVHKKDLPELVQYLGYLMTSQEDVDLLATEVTPYAGLDFSEFLVFMGNYINHETKRFRDFFEEADEDGSGELSVMELRQLMISLGFIPNKPMIEEALSVVDADGNGQLNFTEFVYFLTVYRHAQGFTRRQVKQMHSVFSRFVKGSSLPFAAIAPALVLIFGRHVEKNAESVTIKLLGQGMTNRGKKAGAENEDEEDSLEFPEFLILARRLKEVEAADRTAQFHKYDKDGSGSINNAELMDMLKGLGYQLLEAPVLEVLKEVTFDDGDLELDLGEFFNFMDVWWEREGFLRRELDEIARAFHNFARGGNAIDTKQVSNMFSSLGYRVPAAELAQLVTDVDVNHTGCLDLFEITRIMRTYRDLEVRRLRDIFDSHRNRVFDVLDKDRLGQALGVALGENIAAALHELGNYAAHRSPASMLVNATKRARERTSNGRHTSPDSKSRASKKTISSASARSSSKMEDRNMSINPQLALRACTMMLRSNSATATDFDTFVEMVDLGRARRVERERSNAGFKNDELQEFKAYFESLGANCPDSRSKSSSSRAATDPSVVRVGTKLLTDLQIDWRTKEDQAAVQALLEEARAAAQRVGAEVAETVTGFQIGFAEFVQMLRLLLDRREKSLEETVEAAAGSLSFGWSEVEQFRDIFNSWTVREVTAGQAPGGEVALNRATIESIANTTNKPGLSPSVLVSVVRCLGVSVSPKCKQALVDHALTQDMNKSGQLTFVGFLHMIRWMLDSDFGGINAAAATVARDKASKILAR